jgi:Uma2 family endonuclease
MAAQTLPLSLEEFHKLYDGAKPAYEYWDGKAVQKSVPTILHSLLQLILGGLLRQAGWNAGSEARLKVVREAEPVPDLIAIRGKYRGRYPAAAPELCVEILSPGDSLEWAFRKAARYIQWGTECVWIIDPEKRTAWTLLKDSPEPTSIPPDGALQIRETTIALPALFAEVDKWIEDPGEPA